MAAPSFDELVVSFTAEAQDRRPDLTFDEGDISEMDAAGGAAMADHVVAWTAQRIRETFLDGASGDALTVLADDHWNIQRHGVVAAVGEVTFNRATAGAGAGTLAAGFVVATVKDALGREVQVATQADVTYGALETGDKTVQVEAVVGGAAGNVAAGNITRVVTSAFDPSITVTNADAVAGGADAEGDDELRARVRDFSSTIRRGTLAALEYGAKQVPGVANATANDNEAGIVSIYVADSSGTSNQLMLDAVAVEIEDWRAAGILVNVYGGTIYNVSIAVAVQARTGVDTAALVDKIKAAVVAKVNKLKIGETLYHDQIKEAVTGVDPDGIAAVTVTLPALDLVPLATQLIRTDAGSVTVS